MIPRSTIHKQKRKLLVFSSALLCLSLPSLIFLNMMLKLSQTSFSLYLHNQWTNFYKPSCTRKSQMRAICTYAGGTRVTTND